MRGNLGGIELGNAGEGSIPAYAGEPVHIGHHLRQRRVYPRVCGGTSRIPGLATLFLGLSPRMRGNLIPALGKVFILRSIPAYAGEPLQGRLRHEECRVYPRVCGGTAVHRATSGRAAGLSPRMRGNRAEPPTRIATAGSIPAYAGEPPGIPAPRPPVGVYPRVCGGTCIRPGIRGSVGGLSPRMRGNPAALPDGQLALRSIPAYAGEPGVMVRFGVGSHGLSPRMRGNPAGRLPAGVRQRSIPAYAGEPPGCCLPTGQRGVYPRVCGGTRARPPIAGRVAGLSPRMRGNPTAGTARTWRARSIPAYAGEPRRAGLRRATAGVYPRVCGGTVSRLPPFSLDNGLSPRMRGNHKINRRRQKTDRSIPAYAGEPRPGHYQHFYSRVYPRVCGGTDSPLNSGVNIPGLSPRMRGNRLRLRADKGWGGGLSPRMRGNPSDSACWTARKWSIPAYAGEPCACGNQA